MNLQHAYLPLAVLFVAAFAGKTWYDATLAETGTPTHRPPLTIAIESTPPPQPHTKGETPYSPTHPTPVLLPSNNARYDTPAITPTKQGEQDTGESIQRLIEPNQEDDTLREIINSLDNEFYSQTTDEHWALESGSQIYAYFEQVAQQENRFGSELRSIECRSSLCKVTVLHENMEAADDFSLHFPIHVGAVLPTINYQFENLPDGKINVLMFLAADTRTAR